MGGRRGREIDGEGKEFYVKHKGGGGWGIAKRGQEGPSGTTPRQATSDSILEEGEHPRNGKKTFAQQDRLQGGANAKNNRFGHSRAKKRP